MVPLRPDSPSIHVSKITADEVNLPVVKSLRSLYQLILEVCHWDCKHKDGLDANSPKIVRQMKRATFPERLAVPVTVTVRGERGQSGALTRTQLCI